MHRLNEEALLCGPVSASSVRGGAQLGAVINRTAARTSSAFSAAGTANSDERTVSGPLSVPLTGS